MKLEVDAEVVVDGRKLVVRGFDPMGVPAPRVYLEDPLTGERVVELLARFVDTPTLRPERSRERRPS